MEPQELARQLRKPEGEAGTNIGNQMNQSNGFMNRVVFEQTAVTDGESILEIGFGNGKLVKDLIGNAKHIRYCGIDYSADMVREASFVNRTMVEEGACEFRQADFSEIPYKDESFDKICTINTIYFQEDLEGCLKECLRVLKPGGKIFIGIRPRHIVKDFPFIQHGFTLYEPEEVENLLKNCGFQETGNLTKDDPQVKFDGQEMLLKCSCIYGRKP